MSETPSKPFIYLIQAAKGLPEAYRSIESPSADVLLLTWKEPAEGAIFLPKSSWTAGRNRLIAEAKSRGRNYLYYILLDDDVNFEEGDWLTFERHLLQHRPAAAVPHCPWYSMAGRQYLEMDAQVVVAFDAMFSAFHRDVIADGLVLPYHAGFDKESWWYSQWFVIELMQVLYPDRTLQFNRVRVGNTGHGEYPKKNDWAALRSWFDQNVLRPPAIRRRLLLKIKARLREKLGLKPVPPRPRESHRLSPRQRRRLVKQDARFFTADT